MGGIHTKQLMQTGFYVCVFLPRIVADNSMVEIPIEPSARYADYQQNRYGNDAPPFRRLFGFLGTCLFAHDFPRQYLYPKEQMFLVRIISRLQVDALTSRRSHLQFRALHDGIRSEAVPLPEMVVSVIETAGWRFRPLLT
jgi:hypothetical protein